MSSYRRGPVRYFRVLLLLVFRIHRRTCGCRQLLLLLLLLHRRIFTRCRHGTHTRCRIPPGTAAAVVAAASLWNTINTRQ